VETRTGMRKRMKIYGPKARSVLVPGNGQHKERKCTGPETAGEEGACRRDNFCPRCVGTIGAGPEISKLCLTNQSALLTPVDEAHAIATSNAERFLSVNVFSA